MADRLTDDQRERLADFAVIVRQAQRELSAVVRVALLSGEVERASGRRLHLGRVVAVLDQLAAEIDPRARRIVQDAFQSGAERMARDLQTLHWDDSPEMRAVFEDVSADALLIVQESMVGRLTGARQAVGRQIDDVFARAGKRAAIRRLLGVDDSREAARRQLVADLLRNRDVARQVGETGTFKLRPDGRNWALDDYCDMVVRTTTSEATAQAAMLKMASVGADIFRWRTVDPCPICKPWSDRLVSISGRSHWHGIERVVPYDSTPGLPAHPRCDCSPDPVAARVKVPA